MKEKIQRHPRLYINISNQRNNFKLYYYDNRYDSSGNHEVSSTLISSKEFIDTSSSDEQKIYKLNQLEFKLLKNLIKKQEKVVKIYLKKNKTEQYRVVRSSLELLVTYEKLFLEWFSDNKII